MAHEGSSLRGIEAVSRTTGRRFGVELIISAALGLATALGVVMLHARLAPLDVQTVMMNGSAVADDPANPQWFSVVCAQRGAMGVLSRRAGDMDAAVAGEIVAANRESAARLPRLPAWSAVRDGSAEERLGGSQSLFEAAHGWPAPMFYRMERLDTGAWERVERETASVSRALLPGGALIDIGFFAVVWLFVIRLPGSFRRARRWFAKKTGRRLPGPPPWSGGAALSGEGDGASAA